MQIPYFINSMGLDESGEDDGFDEYESLSDDDEMEYDEESY